MATPASSSSLAGTSIMFFPSGHAMAPPQPTSGQHGSFSCGSSGSSGSCPAEMLTYESVHAQISVFEEMVENRRLAKLIEMDDHVGVSFHLATGICLASTIFFFAQVAFVPDRWRNSMVIAGLVTGVAWHHYQHMQEIWEDTSKAPTIYRYMDWFVTVPLQVIEFYLILVAANPDDNISVPASLFYRLLIGSIFMLGFGYAGEAEWMDRWGAFAAGCCCWAYIMYEISFGEAARISGKMGLTDRDLFLRFVSGRTKEDLEEEKENEKIIQQAKNVKAAEMMKMSSDIHTPSLLTTSDNMLQDSTAVSMDDNFMQEHKKIMEQMDFSISSPSTNNKTASKKGAQQGGSGSLSSPKINNGPPSGQNQTLAGALVTSMSSALRVDQVNADSVAMQDYKKPEAQLAFEILRAIFIFGWALYPIGYAVKGDGTNITQGVENTLNAVYNVADLINKVAFGGAIYYAACSNVEAEKAELYALRESLDLEMTQKQWLKKQANGGEIEMADWYKAKLIKQARKEQMIEQKRMWYSAVVVLISFLRPSSSSSFLFSYFPIIENKQGKAMFASGDEGAAAN
ncbi:unnamed protein product [Amoebophrya sp. A120]|nr:unnamed protein product [Amoebophrya sp. A120]|eukprot:GSA120T00019556001.1